MCNLIFLKPKRTTFFFTLVSEWTEQQAKIQAKFPGDHDGGPLAQCLCFQCSSMFEAALSRLRQTPSTHSNMCRGSAHFSHVCFHKKKKKKLPVMENLASCCAQLPLLYCGCRVYLLTFISGTIVLPSIRLFTGPLRLRKGNSAKL